MIDMEEQIRNEDAQQEKNLRQVISVVGAGGKTSYIQYMAECYRKKGYKVLISTTTHMLLPKAGCMWDPLKIKEQLEEYGWAIAGNPIMDKGLCKMGSLNLSDLRSAMEYADIVLLEADGARGLPFKAPKPWEPVVLPETTKLVVMAGLAALDAPVEDSCYNHEEICRILKIKPTDYLTREQMETVLYITYVKEALSFKKSLLIEIKYVTKTT